MRQGHGLDLCLGACTHARTLRAPRPSLFRRAGRLAALVVGGVGWLPWICVIGLTRMDDLAVSLFNFFLFSQLQSMIHPLARGAKAT